MCYQFLNRVGEISTQTQFKVMVDNPKTQKIFYLVRANICQSINLKYILLMICWIDYFLIDGYLNLFQMVLIPYG